MEPIYRKVFIKSEADLPKKRGEYYFFHKIGESILRHICYCYKTDDMELLPKAYMDNCDWYLRPVELPSDEEREKDFISFANYFHHWKEKIRRGVCPKRPDEIYKEWLRYKLINK